MVVKNEVTEYIDALYKADENDKRIIKVSGKRIEQIQEFIPELIKKKIKEAHYKIDHESLQKRMYTGYLATAFL